jgi:hypothetical protein
MRAAQQVMLPKEWAMPPVDEAVQPAERQSPLASAAQRLVGRIEVLVEEVERLRADNASLRREVRQAVSLFEAAGTDQRPRGDRKPTALGRRRRGPRAKAAKGRATPKEVTSDVVRAVLIKLGEATAAEIASEITKAGAPVGGRAVRFLAERAGATTAVGADGQRRYRLTVA